MLYSTSEEEQPMSGAVWIVEDDAATRKSLMASLRELAGEVHAVASAEEFLEAFVDNQRPACLVVDERLPGMSGTELLSLLQQRHDARPAVVVTGYATTQLAVRAMRNGAITVLDKPPSDAALRQAVAEGLQLDAERIASQVVRSSARAKIERLSPSERQVLEMVLEGVPNKQIAGKLGVCVRTVEARRSRIYQSTDVGSVAALVRLSIAAGLVDAC